MLIIASLPQLEKEDDWCHVTEELQIRPDFESYQSGATPTSDVMMGDSVHDVFLKTCIRDLRDGPADSGKVDTVLSQSVQKFTNACFKQSLTEISEQHTAAQHRFSPSFPEVEQIHEQLILRQQNAEQCLRLIRINQQHAREVPPAVADTVASYESRHEQYLQQQMLGKLEQEASYLCSSITRDIERLMREMAIFKAKVSIEADRASLVHTKAGLSQSESVNRLTKLAFVFM